MKLVEELYKKIAIDVFGKTEFEARGYKFDLEKNGNELIIEKLSKRNRHRCTSHYREKK